MYLMFFYPAASCIQELSLSFALLFFSINYSATVTFTMNSSIFVLYYLSHFLRLFDREDYC